MVRTRASDPGRTIRRRRLVLGAVGLFVIVDVLLVAFAFADSSYQSAARAPASDLSAAPSPSLASATPEPSPTAEPVSAVPPTRILRSGSPSFAWRAETGPCPDVAASPELTNDGGVTWKATDASGPTGVRSLQSITIEGPRVASMIGQASQGCAVTLIRTYVSGDNYGKYPADLPESWYVDPLNRSRVHSPEGDFAAPCTTVVALAQRERAAAAILCADRTVFLTLDSAATWSAPIAAEGVVALATSGEGYVLAAVGAPDCAGVEIVSITDPTVPTEMTGCLGTDAAPASFAGTVAMSKSSGTLWIWAKDILARSADGGATWL